MLQGKVLKSPGLGVFRLYSTTVFYLENFFLGGSVKYVRNGPTWSAKILQRVHGEDPFHMEMHF